MCVNEREMGRGEVAVWWSSCVCYKREVGGEGAGGVVCGASERWEGRGD